MQLSLSLQNKQQMEEKLTSNWQWDSQAID